MTFIPSVSMHCTTMYRNSRGPDTAVVPGCCENPALPRDCAVSSAEEHLPYTQEVTGSNPVPRTRSAGREAPSDVSAVVKRRGAVPGESPEPPGDAPFNEPRAFPTGRGGGRREGDPRTAGFSADHQLMGRLILRLWCGSSSDCVSRTPVPPVARLPPSWPRRPGNVTGGTRHRRGFRAPARPPPEGLGRPEAGAPSRCVTRADDVRAVARLRRAVPAEAGVPSRCVSRADDVRAVARLRRAVPAEAGVPSRCVSRADDVRAVARLRRAVPAEAGAPSRWATVTDRESVSPERVRNGRNIPGTLLVHPRV